MSIHGACFDSGISGNCGWECIPFLEGECNIADEFANSGEYLNEERLLILYEVYGIVIDNTIQPTDPFSKNNSNEDFYLDKFNIDT